MNEFLVDSVLPTNEIHLVAGPSGAGKTTWLLQFIEGWRQEHPFFGHISHGSPFIYLSADRSERSVLRTFARLRIDPDNFNIETASTITSHDMLAILKQMREKHPDFRVIFIEGFQSFTPQHKMNDYGTVATFLTKLLTYCVQHDITIVGVCHATKTKKDETYENPRQKINGSVAWAAYSDTIIFIEPADPSDPNNHARRILLLPRNAAERMYMMEFKDGILTEKTKPQTSWDRMIAWINTLDEAQQVTTEQIMVATHTPRSTLALDISKACGQRLLKQIKIGVYRKVSLDELDA